ncbi:MAG: hypothetical protein ABI675_15550 [Chitinophagaceae bacterium]
MDATKIRLSSEEETLVATADWILTKNRVIQKINLLLSDVQISQQQLLEPGALVRDEILTYSPKISKGENYKGLPWLVLDYPRYFSKGEVFAIRTLFWWGNFFSITLHLSGNYKTKYEKKIIDSFESLKGENFSVCINEDQWEHHFETTNYLPVHDLNGSQFREIIVKRSFIKLAKKIPLEQWNEVEKKLLEIFSQLINTLKDQKD